MAFSSVSLTVSFVSTASLLKLINGIFISTSPLIPIPFNLFAVPDTTISSPGFETKLSIFNTTFNESEISNSLLFPFDSEYSP